MSPDWTRLDNAQCDLCSSTAVWRHPLGGLRCSKCPRPAPDQPPLQTVSCNLHTDCNDANAKSLAARGRDATHCWADDCEECFGN